MYYINATPSENGNYGNPQSNGREDMLTLPDELLSAYIETMGFAILTVDDSGLITAVEINQEAYDKYQEEHPPQPEPEPEPSEQDWIEAQVLRTALQTDTLIDVEG